MLEIFSSAILWCGEWRTRQDRHSAGQQGICMLTCCISDSARTLTDSVQTPSDGVWIILGKQWRRLGLWWSYFHWVGSDLHWPLPFVPAWCTVAVGVGFHLKRTLCVQPSRCHLAATKNKVSQKEFEPLSNFSNSSIIRRKSLHKCQEVTSKSAPVI